MANSRIKETYWLLRKTNRDRICKKIKSTKTENKSDIIKKHRSLKHPSATKAKNIILELNVL